MNPGQRKPMAFSYEEIKNGLLSIGNAEDRFMLAVSYANGTRVSEVVGLKAVDIDITEEFIYITTPVKKKRYRTELHRAPPISRKGEKWLADLIIRYVEGKTGKLISFGVRTAQRRFNSYFGCTSHSFRHTRAMHGLTVLKLSMPKIQAYFKLSPKGLTDWIIRYGHLDREDLEQHLRRRFEE